MDTTSELAWLTGHRFQSLTRRDFNWVLVFDKEISLAVSCLWRLVRHGRIEFTSQDDGQQFGLPAPVDAAVEVNRRLAGTSVEAVELRKGILDLELRFSSGHVFQIIPDSSGYEAWTLSTGNRQFIAVGGYASRRRRRFTSKLIRPISWPSTAAGRIAGCRRAGSRGLPEACRSARWRGTDARCRRRGWHRR